MKAFRCVLFALLSIPMWAGAQIMTIDGAPFVSGSTEPRLFVYESIEKPLGYEGNFASVIAGKCKELPAGYRPGYVWVSITKASSHAHRLGSSQIPCDSEGNFSGSIEAAIDTFTVQYMGETTANLFIELCAFFCQSEPPTKIVLRSLDASVFGQMKGTSQNKVLDFGFAIGTELSSYPGDNHVYLLVAYGGDLFVVNPSSNVSCDTPVRLRFYSESSAACYSFKIVPYTPQTIRPFATAPASAGPATLKVEFSMGPLTGLSGLTFVGGFGKSFSEVVTNHQWNVLATLY